MPVAENFASIRGVELFRPGTWHGRKYTNKDMIRMAANSERMKGKLRQKLRISEPLMKVGDHTSAPQALLDFFRKASMGTVASFYTKPAKSEQGEIEHRVYADFDGVPTVLAEAIRDHFPERSVEKYKTIEDPDTGEVVDDVIASVAFLGTIPPEVKALGEKYAVLFDEGDAQRDGLETFTSSDLSDEDSHATAVTVEPSQFSAIMNVPTMLDVIMANLLTNAAAQQQSKRSTRMLDKTKVKEMMMSGKSDEDILKAFEADGLTPEMLNEMKADWQKEKDAAASADTSDTKKTVATSEGKSEGFSEGQVSGMIAAAMRKQQEMFDARLTAQKEEFSARAQELEAFAAKAQHDKLETWYDGLKKGGMPASADDLNLVGFAEKLSATQLETFAEGQPQATMQDRFVAIVEHFAASAKIVEGSTIPGAMKNADSKPSLNEAIEQFATKNPTLSRQELMIKIAGEQPQVFEMAK